MRKLIEAQERVAVGLGDRFQPVVGRPPLPDVALQPTAAPDGPGDMQGCGKSAIMTGYFGYGFGIYRILKRLKRCRNFCIKPMQIILLR